MKLAETLDKDLVVVNLKARFKHEAISEILDKVIVKFPHLNRNLIEACIFEREEIENTSYGRGFAFPHARTDSVDRMYTALGLSQTGLEEKTSDNKKLQVICLMLTPSTISKSYLQTLSAFASLARTEGYTERLLSAGTAEETPARTCLAPGADDRDQRHLLSRPETGNLRLLGRGGSAGIRFLGQGKPLHDGEKGIGRVG